jgi:hypothetical protein
MTNRPSPHPRGVQLKGLVIIVKDPTMRLPVIIFRNNDNTANNNHRTGIVPIIMIIIMAPHTLQIIHMSMVHQRQCHGQGMEDMRQTLAWRKATAAKNTSNTDMPKIEHHHMLLLLLSTSVINIRIQQHNNRNFLNHSPSIHARIIIVIIQSSQKLDP